MTKLTKTLECKIERLIPASPERVYDAWLNRENRGSPWHEADKLILNPTVDGFFYWLVHGTTHYGRFTQVQRPRRLQHTWVSPHTLGEESRVTLTFKKKGEETLMTLVHSDFPEADAARAHEDAWNNVLGVFAKQFSIASRK